MKNYFSTFLKISALFFLFLLITVNLLGQSNFSGTWVFNESKSNFGESQFRFAATSQVVAQDEKVLTVESTMPGRDGGEMKMTAKYNLDGSLSENPVFNTTRKSNVSWSADKKSITIASTMTFERDGESREFKSTEVWKLTDDGKMLMVENSRIGRDGVEVKIIVAYDKK